MTVEAKIRITPVLDRAVAALRTVVDGLKAVGKEAAAADALSANPKMQQALKAGAQWLDLVRQKAQAAGQAADAADKQGGFGKTRAGLDAVAKQLQTARSQFLAFLGLQQGIQGVAALATMSDQYQSLRSRLRLVTDGTVEFNAALGIIKDLSTRYNQPLAETGNLYIRLAAALKPLGGGMREAKVATEAMLAALKISGASTDEARASILQYGQALGSGVLRGDEFNSMAEAAPRLLKALADGLGKPASELRALAEQGKLTTAALIGALAKALPDLQREAQQIPGTIGGAYEQLISKVQQYIGAQAEANGAASNAIKILKLLAEHIGLVMKALEALALLLGAGALVKGGQYLLALGGGATKAAAGVGLLSGVVRGLIALLSGPVGLTVALAAVAAAWLSLGNSNKTLTTEQAKTERDDVNAEIATMEAAFARSDYKANAKGRYQRLLARRKMLEEQIARDEEYAAFKPAADNEDLRRIKRGMTIAVDDPGSIKTFNEANKTRLDTVKEFADKRRDYILAQDRKIEKAQAAGNTLEVQNFKQDKADHLKEAAYKEREALKAYDTRDAITRIAQAKAFYDKDLELVADATGREKKLVQEQFDQGLLDLERYLAEKARLSEDESRLELARLQTKHAEEQRVLAENRKLVKTAKDPNATQAAEEAVAAGVTKVAELEVQIEKTERDRIENARLLRGEAKQYAKELQDLDIQIRQALGNESPADIRRRVEAAYKPQMDQAVQRGGGESGEQAKRLRVVIDLTVDREVLAQALRVLHQARETLKLEEDSVALDLEAGLITQEQAEQRILDLRRAQLPVLQAQVLAIEKIASGLGQEEKNQAEQARLGIKQLGDLRTEAEKSVRTAASDGLGTFFSDVASGAQTVGQALKDMVGNFAKTILNLISQRLGAQLVNSLMPSGGSVMSSVMSFFGFHSGGVVEPGNATFTRSVNLAAMNLAPRYHTGGIAGMAPRSDELYAVLQRGEEVLTADDPRHVRNLAKGGAGLGGVSVSVTVNGASGDGQALNSGGAELGRMVEAVVDQWAVKQSRPGGILAGRTR